ncbi:hypothetical protein HDU67_003078 [Dinochytrium kinnereticum]|nr:hypothetical protein HDU67_003078 [Dinochytrium kinnereticum]
MNEVMAFIMDTTATATSPAMQEPSRRAGGEKHTFKFGDSESMQKALDEFIRDSKHFYTAIDWKEPFILSLIGFHILTLFWIIAVRKSQTLLMGTMTLLGEASPPVGPLMESDYLG